MNELLPKLTSHLFLSLPGFKLYALCAIILVIKMYAVGVYTAVARGRLKVILNPEDAPANVPVATDEHPDVQRVQRAHRNDLENIPSFLFLGLIALLCEAPPTGLQICFVAFTVSRVAHSLAYLKGLQPWRSLGFGVGVLSNLALSVMIVMKVLS